MTRGVLLRDVSETGYWTLCSVRTRPHKRSRQGDVTRLIGNREAKLPRVTQGRVGW